MRFRAPEGEIYTRSSDRRDSLLWRSHPRKARRYRFDAPVRIYWGSVGCEVRVRDVSEQGLFLETATPLLVGAVFSAKMPLAPPLRMDCVVRHIQPNRGMGVEVSFTNEESQQCYVDLVEYLVRLAPEAR